MTWQSFDEWKEKNMAMKSKSAAADARADKKGGIKEGSKRDQAIDKKKGIKDRGKMPKAGY
jgi:hypothetical protein